MLIARHTAKLQAWVWAGIEERVELYKLLSSRIFLMWLWLLVKGREKGIVVDQRRKHAVKWATCGNHVTAQTLPMMGRVCAIT